MRSILDRQKFIESPGYQPFAENLCDRRSAVEEEHLGKVHQPAKSEFKPARRVIESVGCVHVPFVVATFSGPRSMRLFEWDVSLLQYSQSNLHVCWLY